MLNLKPGDLISCKIQSSTIVIPYRKYDEIKTFTIVSATEHGYYVFVPHFYYLNGCVKVNSIRIKNLNIDKKYMDENIAYVQENFIFALVKKQDGLCCKICFEFFPYAVPNQEDKETLICYACRQRPNYNK